ncbi:MAG: DUF4332 domain-containing protein [Caldilineaceae bacterium]|nr:DUF4332 domain-containing protein [Caldilineaceae bacterium]
MPTELGELKGITAEIAAALRAMQITDSSRLYAATRQPRARAELAAALGIDEQIIVTLANCADLMRVPGVAGVYLDLLEWSGVDSVMELQRRAPENLCAQMMTVALHHHISQIPRLDEVRRWVRQAKQLQANK